MTYEEAVEFLYSRLPAYHRIGKPAYKADLKNTLELDAYFGHPHLKFKSVHIAGTNGKGSVSHMLASVLQTAGYKTGLYTSPHLKDFRERIRINGEMIPEERVVCFVQKHKEIIENLKPSFFEMTVAMAFNYFAEEKIDVAVIETGLGGRLDSTNIITPVLSVITNIGHDHMDLLGDTLEKVAYEKAGIIKEGIPVVVGETQPESAGVFISRAKEMSAEISFADGEFFCTPDPFDPASETREFTLKSAKTGEEVKIKSPLRGDYQSKNIPVVFVSALKLGAWFKIGKKDIIEGIENVVRNTGLAGRWQILGRKPLIICDTGHNKEGIELVISQLVKIPASKRHFVIGFVSDKDVDSILPLFPADARYYFARSSVFRAMDENILKEKAMKYGLCGEAFDSVKEALNKARSEAGEDDLIFIGGSTFVVADAL
ncbi:MAG TPA: folylpolyglutamate synthase/dihydrofolate synthase family protein [Bacteroidales bacterium]|nr:folylpolyglutamate synthase/dihydrofolate synthase family protein [Bacteroidales bacterium]HOK75364.1 folylpolyglutamate synthase/dihydrofolate synthase family protein [Bacteroidales bacterium]HOM41837.1 folylpolyglutamate synthase/dihydrofolate synthase family protein [Bacteroidales bacterium]HPP92577.1 folylpolyglutamate synthase/dihydrofolate synthase family protein [Bacteroidales bacterium]